MNRSQNQSTNAKFAEDLWLDEQDEVQRGRFLKEFCTKSSAHHLDGLRYPTSNSRAMELLLKCQSNNKFLKRIQNKASSDPITKADDLLVFSPDGPYGPIFFNKKSAVRLLNLAMIHEFASRSRRSRPNLHFWSRQFHKKSTQTYRFLEESISLRAFLCFVGLNYK